jgi:hypothetical protein
LPYWALRSMSRSVRLVGCVLGRDDQGDHDLCAIFALVTAVAQAALVLFSRP